MSAPTGWDEALPAKYGKPDLQRNAYVGDGPLDQVASWFYGSRLLGSRIDSDAHCILKFVTEHNA